jgi:hypothetical protein
METEEVTTNGQGQIYGLMANVLSEVGAVGKTRSNQQQGYKFRGIDDVYEAVHPLFAKHGIFTIPRILAKETTERTTTTGTILRFVEVSMAYDFFAPDGSHVTAEVIGEAMDSGDKASNKAMSAAQKYALIQTLCIPTGNTPDADSVTHDDLTPDAKTISKSNTADQKCPDCGGQMWDNRETKKGRQPDFKCKDKGCGKAIWLDKEPITNGFDSDSALRDSLFGQAEKLLSKLDEPKRKEALGRLLMLSTNEMAKKVSELAENTRKKAGAAADPVEEDRLVKIREIRRDAKPEQIDKYLAEQFENKTLDTLSADAINQIHEEFSVPF